MALILQGFSCKLCSTMPSKSFEFGLSILVFEIASVTQQQLAVILKDSSVVGKISTVSHVLVAERVLLIAS